MHSQYVFWKEFVVNRALLSIHEAIQFVIYVPLKHKSNCVALRGFQTLKTTTKEASGTGDGRELFAEPGADLILCDRWQIPNTYEHP